jgi:hypothetical protein
MNKPTYSVKVDWDCADWSGAFDFSQAIDDITDYVIPPIKIARTSSPGDWVYPAATMEIKLNNESGRFYPTLNTSPLFGKIRIWLPVQVIMTHLTIPYTTFTGFICRFSANPLKGNQEIYLYVTDAMDVLAKQIIIQDMDNKTTMTDGEAVIEVLNAAGWSAARRTIDLTGGDIITMPDTFAFEP